MDAAQGVDAFVAEITQAMGEVEIRPLQRSVKINTDALYLMNENAPNITNELKRKIIKAKKSKIFRDKCSMKQKMLRNWVHQLLAMLTRTMDENRRLRERVQELEQQADVARLVEVAAAPLFPNRQGLNLEPKDGTLHIFRD